MRPRRLGIPRRWQCRPRESLRNKQGTAQTRRHNLAARRILGRARKTRHNPEPLRGSPPLLRSIPRSGAGRSLPHCRSSRIQQHRCLPTQRARVRALATSSVEHPGSDPITNENLRGPRRGGHVRKHESPQATSSEDTYVGQRVSETQIAEIVKSKKALKLVGEYC